MELKRRVIMSGSIAAALYAIFVLFVILFVSGIKPWYEVVFALLVGVTIAFIIGSVSFGLVPHMLGKFMANTQSSFELLNKASLGVSLIAILVGVLSALMLIFGEMKAMKPLLVSIVFFVGAASIMCTLKFFYTNRDRE